MLNRHIVKHENSILNPALQNKKKLEGLVDNYVADGLNIENRCFNDRNRKCL